MATNLLLAKNALCDIYKNYALPSAEAMFKLAQKITPDLILLDVDMPDMNGFEAMAILKNDDKLKSIPVIFLTGRSDANSEIEGFKLGAIDFIHKPFTTPILQKRIEVHLELDKRMKTIQQQNEMLIRLHETKDNILGMISHDLRNYIGVTLASCEMLIIKDANMAENNCVCRINEASEKALCLLNDILLMNKMDTNVNALELSKHSVNEKILSSVELLKPMAAQKGIDIGHDFETDPIYAMINAEKFQRVIDNICINAIKFTKNGGKITVKTKQINGNVQIHIIDSGIGMDSELIEKLFQQYSKKGRPGTAGEPSTGLGLYIVKQLIDMHYGTIEVLSEVDVGSEFIIKLPTINDVSENASGGADGK